MCLFLVLLLVLLILHSFSDSKMKEHKKDENHNVATKTNRRNGTIPTNSRSPKRIEKSPEKQMSPQRTEESRQFSSPSKSRSPHSAKSHSNQSNIGEMN